MKVLHFNLYNDGNAGLCNILMSIENALLIAKLTQREKILFYGNSPIFNSEKKLTTFDLFQIDFPYEIIPSNDTPSEVLAIPANFYTDVLYYKEKPSEHFLNGRTNSLDLSALENVNEIRTENKNTLSWYSHLFFFGEKRTELVDWLKKTLYPKKEYSDYALSFLKSIKEVYPNGHNSIHLRRGDYTLVTSARNKDVTLQEILPVIEHHFKSSADLLIVHTDEKDSNFFEGLKDKFPNLWFIENDIKYGDSLENSLISLLVASHSKNFIGTYFSTFTGMIQRYRMYNGLAEYFKYLFTQREDYPLKNGKFPESISHGENTWSRISLPADLKQINFWAREYPEAYHVKNSKINQFITVHPNFITDLECEHIINLAEANRSEYFDREKRSRVTPHIDTDPVLRGLVQRACDSLGYDYKCVEPSLQIFRQEEGGETFSHVDSVYEDAQGKRISSVLFYVNDNFKGSTINFPYLGMQVQPQKGMMFCYPLLDDFGIQSKTWTHSTSLITRGVKTMAYFSLKEFPQ